MVKLKLSERKKAIKTFHSECHKSSFTSKSNGLWTYYVCNDCGKKTTPVNGKGKMLGMYGEIEKYKKQNHD